MSGACVLGWQLLSQGPLGPVPDEGEIGAREAESDNFHGEWAGMSFPSLTYGSWAGPACAFAWLDGPNIQLSMGRGKIPHFSSGRAIAWRDLGKGPCRSSPATGQWCLPGLKSRLEQEVRAVGSLAGLGWFGQPCQALEPGCWKRFHAPGDTHRPFPGGSVFVLALKPGAGCPLHPAEPLLIPGKKTPSPAWNHWDKTSGGRGRSCALQPLPRGSGFAALPFAGIKAVLPRGFLAPEKARSHQGCDRLAADLERYQMEGFSFLGRLVQGTRGCRNEKAFQIPMLSVLLLLRGRKWSERAPDSKMLPEPRLFPRILVPSLFEEVFDHL